MKSRDRYRDTTWFHIVEYEDDAQVALERLRMKVVHARDFVDAWAALRSIGTPAGDEPRTPDEALEFNWKHYKCGTQSVIDIVRVSDRTPVADRWESETAYALSSDEVREFFGEQEEYVDRVENAVSSILETCDCDMARYVTLLNRENEPVSILFAGVSCD